MKAYISISAPDYVNVTSSVAEISGTYEVAGGQKHFAVIWPQAQINVSAKETDIALSSAYIIILDTDTGNNRTVLDWTTQQEILKNITSVRILMHVPRTPPVHTITSIAFGSDTSHSMSKDLILLPGNMSPDVSYFD